MDLFTLVGKIAIESGNSNAEIDGMIEKAQTLSDALGGTASTAEKSNKTVTDSTTKTATGMSKAVSAMQVALGNLATQGFHKMYSYGKSFFQTGYEYNTLVETGIAHIATLLQTSTEDATAFFREIERFSIDTPLSLTGALETMTSMLGVGIKREEMIDTMQILGDLALGDTEKMQGLAKALTDVRGNTTLLAQDAKQFTNRGIPLYQLLADYYNSEEGSKIDGLWRWRVNEAFPGEFTDNYVKSEMQNTSWIKYDHVLAALRMATSPNGMFYNAMDTAMNTTEGRVERMLDNYQRAAGAATNAIVDVFASDTIPALNDILQQLNEWATENPDALKNLREAFSDFATGGIDLLLTSLQGLLGWWNDHRAEFDSMLVLLGGIAIYTGHPAAGTALIATGAFDAYTEAKNQIEEGSAVGQHLNKDPEISVAVESGKTDELTGMDWFNYHIGAPVVQFLHNLIPGLTVDPSVIAQPNDSDTYGPPTPDWFNPSVTLPEGGDIGGSNSLPALIAAVQSLTSEVQGMTGSIPEAIATGISGITVTGTVTTGNVTLNTGAIVGQLTPRLNLQLGTLNRMSGRNG